jgi:membrane protein implicated in regulation of membrane protease activity
MTLARPFILRRRRGTTALVSDARSMIGQIASVTDAIGGTLSPGHVRVAGEDWPAVSENDAPIEAGATVRVTAIRQATLVVVPTGPAPGSVSQ